MKKALLSLYAAFALSTCLAQWNQVNNGLTANLSGGVKFICGHNGKMFTGTYAGIKLYKSIDYGNNWTEISTPVISGIPVSTHSSGNRLFFGLNVAWDNVYYTDDDGATWQVATGGPQSSVVRGFYEMSGSLFCYTSNLGVYRSTDNGVTWAQVNNGLTILNVIKLEAIGSRLLACTINGGMYYSDNSGDTWTQSNNGIASNHLAGAQYFRLGTDLYYMDQSRSSYKSADQGNTWVGITNPSFWGITPRLVYRNQQSGNIYMKNAFGLFGEIDSLFSSSDEGVTWSNITGNLPQAFNEATFTEHNGLVFYAFDILVPNQGVYRLGEFNGIEESNKVNFNTFPNPNSVNLMHIIATDNAAVSIYEASGKLIIKTKVTKGNNIIDIASLNPGVYFVSFEQNRQRQVKRLIRQ